MPAYRPFLARRTCTLLDTVDSVPPSLVPASVRHAREVEEREQRKQAAVGVLVGVVAGQKYALLVSLKAVIRIGRHPDNELVIDHPSVSAFHARLAATALSLVSLTDTSTYGVHVNGAHIAARNASTLGGKHVQSRTAILCDGDVVRFAECDAAFTYTHNPAHGKGDAVQTPIRNGLCLPFRRGVFPLGAVWRVADHALGHGTFGVVNLAAHAAAPWLQVACKTVRVGGVALDGDTDGAKLLREIDVLKRLDHPNVTRLLDVCDDAERGNVHMVLELVTGGDLFAYLEKHGALSEHEVQWAAYQLVAALDYLYGIGVAHRDLKPENVLVHVAASYPRVLVADFGWATTLDEIADGIPASSSAPLKRTPCVNGTMQYLAPEKLKSLLRPPPTLQGVGEGMSGARRRAQLARTWFDDEAKGDVWALGLVLFMCACGVHPYESGVFDVAEDGPASKKRKDSWAEFRKTRGEGTLAPRSNLLVDEHDRATAERWLARVKGRVPSWLLHPGFAGWSGQGRDFLGSLLDENIHARPLVAKAVKHAWLQGNRDRLESLYDRVVKRGEIVRPARLRADRVGIARRPDGNGSDAEGVGVNFSQSGSVAV